MCRDQRQRDESHPWYAAAWRASSVVGPGSISPCRRTPQTPPIGRWRTTTTGGHYELSFGIGPADEEKLATALDALWSAAGLGEAVKRVQGPPGFVASTPSARQLLAGGLISAAEVPGIGRVLCKVFGGLEEVLDGGEARHGDGWLDLCLPLGSLERPNVSVGAYPFGRASEFAPWETAIETWFEAIVRSLSQSVPFAYSMSGYEVSGTDLDECRRNPGWCRLFERMPSGELIIHGNEQSRGALDERAT